MKSARDRGQFGVWLREQRLARGYANVPTAVRELRAREGYGVAPSVWAELEAGTRRPSSEQRERIQAFFDSAAPSEADSGDLAAAIRAQTEAMRELVAELREEREQRKGRQEALAIVLGELSGTLEGMRLVPNGKPRSNNG